MAKGKKFDGEVIDPNWVPPQADENGKPVLEPAEKVSTERAAATAEANGTPEPARRVRRNTTERTYWICGQRHHADAVKYIMPKPTIGQARKAMELVRAMPDYAGMILSIYRCVRVA